MALEAWTVVYRLHSESVNYSRGTVATIKLTECGMRKHLVHKLVVPPVPRQRERLRRYVLKLVS